MTPHMMIHLILLKICSQRLLWIIEGEMSKREIMRILDLPHRYNFDQNYFNPTFERKWIEMTLPDKPKEPVSEIQTDQGGYEGKKQVEERV